MLKRIFSLVIGTLTAFLVLGGGCTKNASAPSDANDTLAVPTKSPKRGIAYNLTASQDLEALKSGVSWWYNWSFSTNAPAGYAATYDMEFIPMLWGRNSTSDYAQAESFILAHPEIKYLLVLNEPNLTDQANRTPAQAAADWRNYEQVQVDLASQGRTIKLVGPAMNWGTMTGYADPVVWLDAFLVAYRAAYGGKEPTIDFLAFHWYDYGLASQLDRLAKYGKQIWITEMANWNAAITNYEMQAQQMQQMVALCEQRNDVFRYAWFIGRGTLPDAKHTFLFDATPGQLNQLGQYYISLPFSYNVLDRHEASHGRHPLRNHP